MVRIRVYIYVFTWRHTLLFFNLHPDPQLWVYKRNSKCCLYCQFPWYCVWSVCQARDGQKNATKNGESFRCCQFSLVNIAHVVMSVSWKNRYWSVKSRYFEDTILRFIDIIHISHTRSYDIQSFSHPTVSFGISVVKIVLCLNVTAVFLI